MNIIFELLSWIRHVIIIYLICLFLHIGVILKNNSTESFKVKAGDKIAQAIFSKYLIVDNDEPVNSVRAGGFGSTGLS